MHSNVLSFLLALQFLTRLPVFYHFDPQAADFKDLCGRSVLAYPLVGVFIGSILYCSGLLLPGLLNGNMSELVNAALILLVWVILTGGLHLDGLADSADAWLGGLGDTERTLEIMKDPRSGAAGVIALNMVLLMKFVLIAALLAQHDNESLLFLLAAPVLARATVPALFLCTPYVRKEGMGAIPAKFMSTGAVKLELILLTILCLLLLKHSLIILAGIGVIFYLLRRMMILRIGGTTGDTAGAMVEITESVVLLLAVMAG